MVHMTSNDRRHALAPTACIRDRRREIRFAVVTLRVAKVFAPGVGWLVAAAGWATMRQKNEGVGLGLINARFQLLDRGVDSVDAVQFFDQLRKAYPRAPHGKTVARIRAPLAASAP